MQSSSAVLAPDISMLGDEIILGVNFSIIEN